MSETEFPTMEEEISAEEAELLGDEIEAGILPRRIPMPILPFFFKTSGLYTWKQGLIARPMPRPIPRPLPIRPVSDIDLAEEPESEFEGSEEELRIPFFFKREELRLDVDGRHPQMTASGTLFRGFATRVHWIAALRRTSRNLFTGRIWYKDGDATIFPYTGIRVAVTRSIFANQRRATITYTGAGVPMRTRTYRFASPYFHKVDFEYDAEVGVTPDLSFDTGSHSNRPAGLADETISIEKVFRRAGFQARRNPVVQPIPTDGPDPNTTWSDTEMHDAMQVYWSRFANRPQWALWTLFAKQHDMGSGLGGIMFDDIGPNHRQGTAIFYDSFISTAPAGETEPDAYIKRMHFWTAVHEMGHAFNLAHSWQKNMGTPWIPLAAEPEARSFMNYPYRVGGGQSAFFSNFRYGFSRNELLFMRHAPSRFVQMGNADWFDHHGFEEAITEGVQDFSLEVGIDRQQPVFDFLEPAVLEVKLTNISGEPKLLAPDLLRDTDHMVVVLKKDGKAARQWAPFAVRCEDGGKIVLQPGESVTESFFASAGLNGWDLAEPGLYTVQLAIEAEGRPVVSNQLRLKVTPPMSREEECLAQDIFTEDAARVMAFDGSMVLTEGINAWTELAEKLPDSRAAIHARVALAMPMLRDYRTLRIDAPVDALAIDGQGAFAITKKNATEAQKLLKKALISKPAAAAETLSRQHFERYCGEYGAFLAKNGDKEAAKTVGATMSKVVADIDKRHYPKAKVAA